MSAFPDLRRLVGTTVADKYRVEEMVGEGGFGVVFRARHLIWDQPVALKCFTAFTDQPEHLRDPLLEHFVQEGALMGALSSHTAAIVQARDIGTLTTPDGAWLPYMVLEWLSGASLDAFLRDPADHPRGRRYSALEAFQLLDGPARALAMAHDHNIAHRDIKPANFFVCGPELLPGVVIKLLDFGIAKVMDTRALAALGQTSRRISTFTPNYGAPEQFDREHGATGPWTDVYGLALVMVELMSGGKPALRGDDMMQLAYASQNEIRRPTPRTAGVDVPDAVEQVFRQAVAIDVTRRYPDVGTFWLDLVAALEIRDYPPLPRGDLTIETHRLMDAAITLRGAARSGAVAAAHTNASTGPHPATGDASRTLAARGDDDEPAAPQRARPLPWIVAAAGLAITIVAGAAVAVGRATSDEPPPAPEVAPRPPAAAPAQAPPEPEALPLPPCPEDMSLVDGSNFFMGTDEDGKPALAMARPAHKVEVQTFCMDRREVTARQYRACSDAGECKRAHRDSFWPQGSSKKRAWERAMAAYSELCTGFDEARGDHPINCVTWAQADEYCRVHGKRLPTEAEWEYAARGSDGRVFPWGDDPPSPRHLNGCGRECQAWRAERDLEEQPVIFDADDRYPGTAPVGSFPAGATQHGLLDMVGNVFEWTADSFHPYPAKVVPGLEPEGGPPEDALQVPTRNRVIRGGAFNSFLPDFTNPALRFPMDAASHSHGVGFRCATDPELAGG